MNDLLGLIKQCQRDSERWFPHIAKDLVHQALSLCGEAGEVANLVKKVQRGSLSILDARDTIGEEAVDVLIYLCMIFAILEVDPTEIYKEKRAKNELRFGTGPLRELLDLNPKPRAVCNDPECR